MNWNDYPNLTEFVEQFKAIEKIQSQLSDFNYRYLRSKLYTEEEILKMDGINWFFFRIDCGLNKVSRWTLTEEPDRQKAKELCINPKIVIYTPFLRSYYYRDMIFEIAYKCTRIEKETGKLIDLPTVKDVTNNFISSERCYCRNKFIDLTDLEYYSILGIIKNDYYLDNYIYSKSFEEALFVEPLSKSFDDIYDKVNFPMKLDYLKNWFDNNPILIEKFKLYKYFEELNKTFGDDVETIKNRLLLGYDKSYDRNDENLYYINKFGQPIFAGNKLNIEDAKCIVGKNNIVKFIYPIYGYYSNGFWENNNNPNKSAGRVHFNSKYNIKELDIDMCNDEIIDWYGRTNS